VQANKNTTPMQAKTSNELVKPSSKVK
jgi:hypothetical protein